jgi:1-deoxy-D-xylulose-5-phosphate reductoisomerase
VKAITLLGSTGSIGTQTLDIVQHNPDKFRIVGLASGRNGTLLAEQIRQFRPEIAAICDLEQFALVKAAIADLTPQPILLSGEEGIVEVARYGDAEASSAVPDCCPPSPPSKPEKTSPSPTKKR